MPFVSFVVFDPECPNCPTVPPFFHKKLIATEQTEITEKGIYFSVLSVVKLRPAVTSVPLSHRFFRNVV